MRTSNPIITSANIAKMYLGIAFLSSSKCIAQAGIYGAVIGFTYVVSINLYCVNLLLKARNRFKYDKLVDICDLSEKRWTRPLVSVVLIVTNVTFLMCYSIFFGTEVDQLVCKTLGYAECGQSPKYSFLVIFALLPVIYQK